MCRCLIDANTNLAEAVYNETCLMAEKDIYKNSHRFNLFRRKMFVYFWVSLFTITNSTLGEM